jgi:hypothetical protein
MHTSKMLPCMHTSKMLLCIHTSKLLMCIHTSESALPSFGPACTAVASPCARLLNQHHYAHAILISVAIIGARLSCGCVYIRLLNQHILNQHCCAYVILISVAIIGARLRGTCVGSPQCEVVAQQLHNQGSVLVRLFVQVVEVLA